MIDRDSLFREEALEFHTRGRETPGTVVRLGAPWIRWSYRLVLVLVVTGVVLAAVLRTTTTATGAALVNGEERTFSAMIPAAAARDLEKAEALRIELDGLPRLELDARITDVSAVDPNASVPGMPRPAEPTMLLRGTVSARGGGESPPGRRALRGRATLILRTERVGDIVLRQLRTMFGGRRGGSA